MSNNKTDMERLGLFSEMGYISLGDRYPKLDPKSKVFHESAFKGKQMLPGGSKTRSALQAGYFSGGFQRIMEGESHTDAIQNRRRDRIGETKKNISQKPWLPSSFTKKRTGLGNHYGTFAGTHASFSTATNPSKPYLTSGKNFTTTPGKKGTGYGYANVTFQKYPEHSVDAYGRARELRKADVNEHYTKVQGGPFKLNVNPTKFFDQNPYRSDRAIKSKSAPAAKQTFVIKTPFRPSNPAKKIAGCKAGTFESYPQHSVDLYQTKVAVRGGENKRRSIFHPSPGPKSTPTKSVLETNVIRSMNRNNYKSVKTVMAF